MGYVTAGVCGLVGLICVAVAAHNAAPLLAVGAVFFAIGGIALKYSR